MKYTLTSNEEFVQASDDLHKLLCNSNQFNTWWNGMGLTKEPKDLAIKENSTQKVLYTAAYRRGGVLRWKPTKTP